MQRFGLGLLAAGLTGGMCMADSVYVQYEGRGDLGGFVTVNPGGAAGMPAGPIWAGHNRQIVGGTRMNMFGLDLSRQARTGDHDINEPHAVLGAQRANALNALYGATGGRVGTSEEAIAFQAVMWELMTDYRGSALDVDIRSGSLVFASGVNTGLFNHYKALALDPNRTGTSNQFSVLASGSGQRQAFSLHSGLSVPLPSGAALALAGLSLMSCRRSRT